MLCMTNFKSNGLRRCDGCPSKAFPKTAKAQDLMVDAPTPVSAEQLKELGITVRAPKEPADK